MSFTISQLFQSYSTLFPSPERLAKHQRTQAKIAKIAGSGFQQRCLSCSPEWTPIWLRRVQGSSQGSQCQMGHQRYKIELANSQRYLHCSVQVRESRGCLFEGCLGNADCCQAVLVDPSLAQFFGNSHEVLTRGCSLKVPLFVLFSWASLLRVHCKITFVAFATGLDSLMMHDEGAA